MDYELELLIEIGDAINVLYAKYPAFVEDHSGLMQDREKAKLQLEGIYELLCELYEGIPDA